MIIRFAKTLYSNKAILSFKRMRGWLLFLLFVLNVMMVSAPLILARSLVSGPDVLVRFPRSTEALIVAFEQTDCVILQELQCSTPTIIRVGQYEVGFLQTPTSDSYIYFDRNQVIFQTPDDFFLGGYLFAEGLVLSTITTTRELEDLVYGFATSSAGFDFSLILLGQLIQTMLYVGSLSAMLLISNYRSNVRKITFTEGLRITTLAMVGPALAGGFIGFIEPSFSGIVFLTVFSIRMMYVYFGLFSKTIPTNEY